MATNKAKEKPPPSTTEPDDERDSVIIGESEDGEVNNEIFQVNRLLAEKYNDKEKRVEYLVLWARYPEEEATWEPYESFHDPEGILEQWRQRKERITKGFDEPFDVSAWNCRRKAYKKKKAQEKPEREEDAAQASGAIASPRAKNRKQAIFGDGDDDVDELANSPKHRRLDNESSNDDASSQSSHLSEDSLMNELKSANSKNSVRGTTTTTPRQLSSTKMSIKTTLNTPGDGSSGHAKSSTSAQKSMPPEVLKEKKTDKSVASKPATVKAMKSAPTRDTRMSNGPSTASPILEPNPANASTRQSPIASASKPTATATKRTRDSLPDVMADLDVEPTPRKRKMEEGKLYNILHRHRVEMKGRNEAAPNVNELTLTELATGRVVSQPEPKPVHPKEPPRGPRAAQEPNNLDGLIPLTCPYFDRNYPCEWNPCPFLHRLSDKVASYELYEQYIKQQMGKQNLPKFQDLPTMCPWWYKHKQNPAADGCFRTTEDCWYAHWLVEGGAALLPAQHKTICPYWLNGDCLHGDKCWFVHGEPTQTAPAAESGNFSHPTEPATETKEIVGAGRRLDKRKVPVCLDWQRGRCPYGDKCRFVHGEINQTATTAESDNQIALSADSSHPPLPGTRSKEIDAEYDTLSSGAQEPSRSNEPPRKDDRLQEKFDLRQKSLGKKGLTCAYWYRSGCKLSEEECKYAHELLEGGIDYLPEKKKTCPFWLQGRCKWSDEKCLYAHRHVDNVSWQPRKRGSIGETFVAESASRPPLSRTLSEPAWKETRAAPFSKWPIDSYRPTYREEIIPKTESPSQTNPNEYPLPPDQPTTPTGPRADRYRLTNDTVNVHPGRLGNFTASPISFGAVDQTTHDARLTLSLADNIEDLEFNVTGCSQELRDLLTTTPPKLNVQGIVPLWLLKEMSGSGCNLAYAKLISSRLVVSDMLSNFLMTIDNVAITEVKGAVLLIYFTEETLVTSSSGYTFHLAVLMSKERIWECHTLFSQLIERTFHIKADQFFIWKTYSSNSKSLPPPPKKSVCLFFPEADQAERSMWAIYFKNVGAGIFSYGVKGSWQTFSHDERGAIIVHPDFVGFNFVPNLGKQLMAKRTVYQLGFDRREHGPNAPFEARPLFPYGTTVLITDEIYEKNPAAALQILKHLIKANQGKPHIVWTWKLAGRRGIKHWLLDLAQKYIAELHAGDETRFHLYYALEEIFASEFEDEDDPQHPVDDAPLITMPEVMMEDYAQKWEAGGTGKEECLDTIVMWFAVEAIVNRWGCRRNVVVHEGPVPEKWVKQNQHVVFYTPEKYLSTFGGGGERRVSVT